MALHFPEHLAKKKDVEASSAKVSADERILQLTTDVTSRLSGPVQNQSFIRSVTAHCVLRVAEEVGDDPVRFSELLREEVESVLTRFGENFEAEQSAVDGSVSTDERFSSGKFFERLSGGASKELPGISVGDFRESVLLLSHDMNLPTTEKLTEMVTSLDGQTMSAGEFLDQFVPLAPNFDTRFEVVDDLRGDRKTFSGRKIVAKDNPLFCIAESSVETPDAFEIVNHASDRTVGKNPKRWVALLRLINRGESLASIEADRLPWYVVPRNA